MIIILTASTGKNLELAETFKKKLTELNMQSEILNLVDLNLPLFSPVAETKYSPVEVLGANLGKMNQAVGFVFLSPEYNGGIPPVMTNFIAWVSRTGKVWREAFNSKPAIIGTYSAGNGLGILTSLRSQLAYLGITIIGRQIVVTPGKPLEDSALTDVCLQLKRLSYL